jgi:hypothetical protein
MDAMTLRDYEVLDHGSYLNIFDPLPEQDEWVEYAEQLESVIAADNYDRLFDEGGLYQQAGQDIARDLGQDLDSFSEGQLDDLVRDWLDYNGYTSEAAWYTSFKNGNTPYPH